MDDHQLEEAHRGAQALPCRGRYRDADNAGSCRHRYQGCRKGEALGTYCDKVHKGLGVHSGYDLIRKTDAIWTSPQRRWPGKGGRHWLHALRSQ